MRDVHHCNYAHQTQTPGGNGSAGIPVALLHRPEFAGQHHQRNDSTGDVDQFTDYSEGILHSIRGTLQGRSQIDLIQGAGIFHQRRDEKGTGGDQQQGKTPVAGVATRLVVTLVEFLKSQCQVEKAQDAGEHVGQTDQGLENALIAHYAQEVPRQALRVGWRAEQDTSYYHPPGAIHS